MYDNSTQINTKFMFTVYEYVIAYQYILLSNLIYIYIYIYIYIRRFLNKPKYNGFILKNVFWKETFYDILS